MAKAWVHACSSAKRFGGEPEDYLPIHNHLDSTKGIVADNRHRFITHNAWYIGPDGPLESIFGVVITNSEAERSQREQWPNYIFSKILAAISPPFTTT